MSEPPENEDQAPRDRDDAPYLVGLGQRVREMRAVRGMSRKVLSRVSGISQRYIAQLESGQGNVSILLLRKVASAIGVRIDDLVSDTADEGGQWTLLRDLARAASPERIVQARALLAGDATPPHANHSRHAAPRIALIGLRGAGKSTLGKLAAERLNWPFVELNREIERLNGLSVAEIFAIYGQEGYRRFEQTCLRSLVERAAPMVLATGGGIVAEPLTFDLLLSSFCTIWVKAKPEEHMARVRAQGDLRPMAEDKGAMRELKAILKSREPLYARARASLSTSGLSVDEAVRDVIDLIAQTCRVSVELAVAD